MDRPFLFRGGHRRDHPQRGSRVFARGSGVAGAAGRYALLERVAAVLTADAHPEMFAAYKEELAAACLSGANVDLDERFDDDRFDDEDETARAPSTTPGAAPPLASSRGDLAPGAGTRARGARSNISPRRNAPSPEPPRRRTPRPPG